MYGLGKASLSHSLVLWVMGGMRERALSPVSALRGQQRPSHTQGHPYLR
jgi:hypothetical protein